MGMQMFTYNDMFNPSDWGLEAGDMLQVICVGGGAGGDLVDGGDLIKGSAGGQSSFGSYIVAKGGNTDNSSPSGMSRGGVGASRDGNYAYGGGGAGGYLPGIPVYGGDGGDAYYTDASFSGTVFFNNCAPSGLGGVGSYSVPSNFMPLYYDTMFANLKHCGGNRGSGAGDGGYGGAGGNGYGAGGGAGKSNSSSSLNFSIEEYCGGNSGELVIGSVKLTSSSAISVIIGSGGDGGSVRGYHGGSGAPGVIIVTW